MIETAEDIAGILFVLGLAACLVGLAFGAMALVDGLVRVVRWMGRR